MRHRDLLAALAELKPIRVEGTFQRHSSLRWEELNASAAGGRWGARRAFEVLYLGRPPASVIIEAYRHLVDDELDNAQALAAAALERRVITCRVAVPNVIDLRSRAAQHAVGLREAELCSEIGDYDACQAVAGAAHELGAAGILAPAATRLGETLALYPTNLPVEHWPTVTAREIWYGLPADPRRLRAVEGEAT